jgi:EmrB/QacA subfamily drug resistance transporter
MTLSERVQEHAYKRRWLILAVLCFSLLVIVLDNSILNVAIPTLIDQLHATTSQVQWMVDSYTLVFAGLLLSMGALGDKYGRRGALQVGFLIFGIGSLASALVTTADQLIATRAFMGIGGALIMPATLSIITNVFPANERGKAIGVWAGTAGLGVALGPLTGGFLLEHFYWGSIFLVNLPIVVIGLLAGFFLIPTSKDPSAPRLDVPGALLSIAGLSALLYGIIEAPSNGWTNSTILGAFGLGVVLIGTFVWWETRTDHPMLDVRFFKNPRFSAASSGITLLFFALFGSIFLLTQYLQFTLHFSPLEAGVRMLPFAVTMMVVAPLSAVVVARIGTKITVTLGLTIVTVALVTLTGLNADSSYGSDVVWRFILMGLGMALTMAPATDSVMGSLPLAKAGVGSAVNDTTRQVGGALGVAIIGSVLSSTYGSKISDFFSNQSAKVPPNLRGQFNSAKDVAHDSLGGAIGVANQLPKRGLPLPASVVDQLAADLSRVANQAFVDGMHAGVLVAALATGIGAIVALIWLPARASDQNLAEQAAEYAAEHVADEGAPVEDGVDATAPVLTDSPADIR